MGKHLFSDVRIPVEVDNVAIVRDEEKCVKCGQCRVVCEREIGVGRLYDLASTGDTAICIHCGQCVNACPVDALTERMEYPAVKKAIQDPDKVVIFSTSPSVRVGLAEEFGKAPGTFAQGKMVAALRALGANYVLDTNFSADLTIVEEASELIARVTGKMDRPLPQFTSCCPAWVKFVETFYPDLRGHLSTAKSPIGMQGPTIKTYFAARMGIESASIVNVALTPCTAKKFEIRREEMENDGLRGMDHVITTRELARWMKEEGVDFDSLPDSDYDALMGEASGAGVIFGNTGGVMEAAARTAHFLLTGENPDAGFLRLSPVRGMEGVREAEVTIAGVPLRLAVIHGTDNARAVLEKLRRGEKPYDFVEVMTCRGGCIGGGGQPKTGVPLPDEVRMARIRALYDRDEAQTLRMSHENPEIQEVYRAQYGEPLSPLAEKLLHTTYLDRSGDLGEKGMVELPLTPTWEEKAAAEAAQQAPEAEKWRCTVCGYVHEGPLPADFKCPLCGKGADAFEKAD